MYVTQIDYWKYINRHIIPPGIFLEQCIFTYNQAGSFLCTQHPAQSTQEELGESKQINKG